MARKSRAHLVLDLSAALLGTLPAAFFTGLALARFAPISSQARAALGLYGPLPIYVLFACMVARMHWKFGWLACLAVGFGPWLVLRLAR